jgi:hypothetical protein
VYVGWVGVVTVVVVTGVGVETTAGAVVGVLVVVL